ncbi:MAG: ABC transporter ATP-binding protein [Candidatus Omnitrophica bacterium]|nr:ABC transporter ATP-binding protein [Candidatus Omnitrophota bacterium]
MLEINNLSCGYDDKVVIREMNCQIKHKEIVGIIGPNGSGKTTLLRAITRVLKPKQGEILLKERDIRQMSLKALAREIAVVAQSLPGGSVSVEEFVLLGRIPHLNRLQFLETKQDLAVAERAMSLTDSLRIKDQFIEEISGGERQLAQIARALAQEPTLLLLDEPTAHLDITHQVGVLDLIKRLNREFGLTVIMVLHDLNLASAYCDRLILLHNGGIHQQGSPKQVLTYQTIEEVYQTVVVVKQDPLTSRPYIFLVSEAQRHTARK